MADLGVRLKPSYLVLGTFLGCLSLIYVAWLAVGQMAAAVVFILSVPAIILAGCVAAVAKASGRKRYWVFSHLRETDADH